LVPYEKGDRTRAYIDPQRPHEVTIVWPPAWGLFDTEPSAWIRETYAAALIYHEARHFIFREKYGNGASLVRNLRRVLPLNLRSPLTESSIPHKAERFSLKKARGTSRSFVGFVPKPIELLTPAP
jgi:hypothetical protein